MPGIIWKSYALLLIGVGLTSLPRSLLFGILYLTVALCVYQRLNYARFAAYLPIVLYLLLFLLVAIKPSAGPLFSLRAKLFGMERLNLLVPFFLEPFAQKMWLWGLPKTLTKFFVFSGLIGMLAATHRRYWAGAPRTNLEKSLASKRALRGGAWLSAFVLTAGLVAAGWFFSKDLPPWGGRNPGGPSGGSLFFLTSFFWGPLIVIGGFGLFACLAALRRSKENHAIPRIAPVSDRRQAEPNPPSEGER